jgi:hypothetical protein
VVHVDSFLTFRQVVVLARHQKAAPSLSAIIMSKNKTKRLLVNGVFFLILRKHIRYAFGLSRTPHTVVSMQFDLRQLLRRRHPFFFMKDNTYMSQRRKS